MLNAEDVLQDFISKGRAFQSKAILLDNERTRMQSYIGITKDYLQKSHEWCKQVYCAYKIENLNWQPGELLYTER